MDDTDSDLGMEEMSQMTKVESFWGKTLSSKNRVYEWTGEDEAEEGIDSTVELRAACLGVSDSLKPKDRNVVAVTVENDDGEEEQFVIASLRLEHTEQVSLLHQVQPPVKFELIQGSGPVHLTGLMVSGFAMSGEEDNDDDEEEEEEKKEMKTVKKELKTGKKEAEGKEVKQDPLTIQKGQKATKRPLETSTTQSKPSKVAKINKEEDSDDEEEDEEMDESMENGDLLVEGEDDTDDEEEESDEDDLEDEEESDEEEEMPPPPQKKPQVKGGPAAKLNKPGVSRTPQPTPKNTKPPAKTSMSAQKPGKNATPNKGPLSVDQIKKKLIQSGTYPKKLEKFNNYMTHTFKVSDDNVKKQLWEFVQKNRK